MDGSKRFEWVAEVCCEGGPLIAGDVASIAQWTGSVPFTELREKLGEAAEHVFDRRVVLHFWGHLGGAGERFVECDDEASAIARLEGLVEKVRAHCPAGEVTTRVTDAGIERTRMVDPVSGGTLEAELEPASEYDASWQAHRDEDAWLHAFGRGATAAFWFHGGHGTVEVGVSSLGDELMLLRAVPATIDSSGLAESVERSRALVETVQPDESEIVEIEITTGRVAVLWSPIGALDVVGVESEADVLALGAEGPAPRLDAANATAVGTAVRLRPGRYRVSIGAAREDASVSARWCRWTLCDR